MKKVLIGLLVLGIAGVIVWQQLRLRKLSDENKELRSEPATTTAAPEALEPATAKPSDAEQARLRALQSEVLQLRAKVNAGLQGAKEAPPAQAAPATPAETPSEQALHSLAASAPTNPPPSALLSAMSGAMREAVEQQSIARLLKMKKKLNLSPEQEDSIKKILQKQAQQGLSYATRMFGGKGEEVNPVQEAKAMGNPDKEIEALLNPEQRAAYTQFKEEDRAANARALANTELVQIHNAVTLTPDQQQKVGTALYDLTMRQFKPDPSIGTMDPGQVVDQQFAEKLKAMQTILTPDQIEAYRRSQEAQVKMIKSFLPGMMKPAQ